MRKKYYVAQYLHPILGFSPYIVLHSSILSHLTVNLYLLLPFFLTFLSFMFLFFPDYLQYFTESSAPWFISYERNIPVFIQNPCELNRQVIRSWKDTPYCLYSYINLLLRYLRSSLLFWIICFICIWDMFIWYTCFISLVKDLHSSSLLYCWILLNCYSKEIVVQLTDGYWFNIQ